MMSLLTKLASLRLSLVGMALLAILSVVASRSAGVDAGITIVPLALLVVNLFAALVTNRSFPPQTGLLLFHVGLLLVFACIGLTVMLRYDGHVEVLKGAALDASRIETVDQGHWHENRLDDLEFYQGEIRINYLPGLNRQDTHSTIEYRAASGELRRMTIGDTRTVTIDGYRVAATFNKGFAVLLQWTGADGSEILGAVHMPSFPEFDWKQVTTWTTPAGQELELELDFDEPVSSDTEAWTFGATSMPYALRASAAGEAPHVLREGQGVRLEGGVVHAVDLRTWMAYRVEYLPFLTWMFVAAMLSIIGLAMHFARRYLPAPANADTKEDALAHVARA